MPSMKLISLPYFTGHRLVKWLCCGAMLTSAAATLLVAQERAVNFRYSPRQYFTALCFPDDWQKSVVTERGGLGDDFGPGPYAVPLTEVWLEIKEGGLEKIQQSLPNAGAPIVTTRFAGDNLRITLHTFAVCQPPVSYQAPILAGGRVVRLEGLTGTTAWASPKGRADPAFRNVAWGVNRPVRYRVTVPPNSRKLVALGVCEPYKWGPGTRTLELRVEGAPSITVDPMKTGEKNIPYVFLFPGADLNGDGKLDIEAHASMDSPDANVILNALWVFPEKAEFTAGQILTGEVSEKGELYYDCGAEEELYGRNSRTDAILAEIEGDKATPIVNIRSRREFSYDSTAGIFSTAGRPYLLTRPRPVSFSRTSTQWRLELPRGTTQAEVIVLHGAAPTPGFPDLHRALTEAFQFWAEAPAIPRGRIIVPDSGIQYILDANIRNLYQTRERVDGILQFQPGPSVYRGLWIHDAVWHITAALILGDTASTRAEIDGLVRYQQSDGQVKIMAPWVMIREAPVLVYILCRYAEMTHDRRWLGDHWQNIVSGLAWVERVRAAMKTDPKSTTYGLMPPSFADGGLGGMNVEYSSVLWTLIGIRKAIESARWLEKTSDAEHWQTLYDDLLNSYRAASLRDMKRDNHGNLYLPMKVADTSSGTPPQQAQWSLLEAQYLGHLFDPKDPLVIGTLAMLDASSKEGLALNTGWLKDGLWTFFSGFFGMAHMWQENYGRAQDLLYAYANHASPLGTWVEEQLPVAVGPKTTGDGSNASAGSLFIMFLKSLIALERDQTLDLLAGIPDQWIKPGGTIALNNVPTRFGTLSLHVAVDKNGRSCTVAVSPLRGNGDTGGPRLFLEGFRRLGFRGADGKQLPTILQRRWGESIRLELRRP